MAGLANASILALINRGAAIASATSASRPAPAAALRPVDARVLLGKRYALIQASVIVEHMVRNRLVRVMDKIRRVGAGDRRGARPRRAVHEDGAGHQPGLALRPDPRERRAAVLRADLLPALHRLALAGPRSSRRSSRSASASAIYFRHAHSLGPLLARLTARQAEQIDTVSHMVDGFKEIRLNPRKSDAVFDRFARRVQGRARPEDRRADRLLRRHHVLGSLLLHAARRSSSSCCRALVPTYAAVVLMTTAAILFIIGPLQMVVQAAPVFQRATTALGEPPGARGSGCDDLAGGGRRHPAETGEGLQRFTPRLLLDQATFTYQ